MSAPRHSRSPLAVFFTIYLVISLAVAGAIFLLVKSQPGAGQAPEVANVEEKVISKEPEPGPGKGTAKESPGKTPVSEPGKQAKVDAKEKEKATEPDKPEPESPEPPDKAADKPALSPEEIAEIEGMFPFPEIQPLLEIVKNWTDVPRNAYPKLVAIRRSVEFEVVQNGRVVAKGALPSGSMMVPAQHQGDTILLTASHAETIKVTLPVEETDFKEQVEARYDAYVRKSREEVLAQRKAEVQRRLGAIAKEDAVSEWNDGTDPRFDPAKESLGKGEVGIYSLHEAKQWKWGGTENLDGVDYETAYVRVVSEAAFGVAERELKVLIQGGKVVLWVDPATGEPI